MKIYIDYFIRNDKTTRIMHTLITENDIIEMLTKQFRDGELACPIHFDRTSVEVSFDIAEVRI